MLTMTMTEASGYGTDTSSASRDTPDVTSTNGTENTTDANVHSTITGCSRNSKNPLPVVPAPAPEEGANGGAEHTKSGSAERTKSGSATTTTDTDESLGSKSTKLTSTTEIEEEAKQHKSPADNSDDDSNSREKLLFLLKVASDSKGGGGPNEPNDGNNKNAAGNGDRNHHHGRDESEKQQHEPRRKTKKAKKNAEMIAAGGAPIMAAAASPAVWPGYHPTAPAATAADTGTSNPLPPLPQPTVQPMAMAMAMAGNPMTSLGPIGAPPGGHLAGAVVGNLRPVGGSRYSATELVAAGIVNNVGVGGGAAVTGPATSPPRRRRRRAVPRKRTFAEKLMSVLTDPSCSEAVEWLPDGAAFVITNPVRFAELVLPKYFKSAKFESFTRKLNRW